MQQAVPLLNILATLLYLLAAAATLLLLKMALRSAPRPPRPPSPSPLSQEHAQSPQQLEYGKVAVVAYLKKYTIVGGAFSDEKKYMLKEMLIIGAMGICCLGVNQIIIWPVGLSIGIVVACYLLLDVLVKKLVEGRVEEAAGVVEQQSSSEARPRPESEIEIESVEIEAPREKETVKTSKRVDRSNFEILLVCGIALTSMVLMLQTAMTIGTSISNSGELNLLSLLVMVAIDQFAIRPVAGIVFVGTLHIIAALTDTPMQSLAPVQLLIQQEVHAVLREEQKERQRRRRQMVVSPPRKKEDSPSRVPKALGSIEQPTYLNLISLQPTSKRKSQPSEKDEVIEEIYLTTAQRDMFHLGASQEGRKVQEPRRKSTKENKEYLCFSERRSKFPVIEEERPGFDDLMILKNGPLNEMEDNIIAEFNLQDSPPQHRKKPLPHLKKVKRQLNLSGSSPYLQYLPDMLKKVDGYKNEAAPPKPRKIL